MKIIDDLHEQPQTNVDVCLRPGCCEPIQAITGELDAPALDQSTLVCRHWRACIVLDLHSLAPRTPPVETAHHLTAQILRAFPSATSARLLPPHQAQVKDVSRALQSQLELLSRHTLLTSLDLSFAEHVTWDKVVREAYQHVPAISASSLSVIQHLTACCAAPHSSYSTGLAQAPRLSNGLSSPSAKPEVPQAPYATATEAGASLSPSAQMRHPPFMNLTHLALLYDSSATLVSAGIGRAAWCNGLAALAGPLPHLTSLILRCTRGCSSHAIEAVIAHTRLTHLELRCATPTFLGRQELIQLATVLSNLK